MFWRVTVKGSQKAVWNSGNGKTSWGEDMKKQLLNIKCQRDLGEEKM